MGEFYFVMEGDYRLAALLRRKPKNQLNLLYSSSVIVDSGGGDGTILMTDPQCKHDEDPREDSFNHQMLWLLIIPALTIFGFCRFLSWYCCNKKEDEKKIKYNTTEKARTDNLILNYNLKRDTNIDDDSSSDIEDFNNDNIQRKKRIVKSHSDDSSDAIEIQMTTKNGGEHVSLSKPLRKKSNFDIPLSSDKRIVLDLNVPMSEDSGYDDDDDDEHYSKEKKRSSKKR